MRTSIRLALVLAFVAAPLAAQDKVVVNEPGRNPSPNLSAGVRVGNMFYASGQLGGRADSTIEAQTKTALESTKRVMELGGTTMENVVKCTVFLTRATDFQAMNGVYRTFFPANPPARSTVIVAALVTPSALVEIECMAVIPAK